MKKHRRNGIKHALAAAAFCMVMSIGILCMADEKGTVTVASAKIRASADSSSEQLGSVAQGGNVDIISETTGADGKTWYQVYVDANTKGYIRADLVKKNGSSETTSSNTTATDQSATTATPVDAKKGTVVTSNVRIRKGASTNHDVVATANRGMVVTVTGEANGADGKKWYQISFSYNNKEITGFIRSDLVTFDNVPADTAVSEITGEENNPEASTEPATVEEQEPPQEPDQTSQQANDSANIILMNVEEVPYIMPGFIAVDLNWNDQKINAYKNGNFYIFYAQKQNGEEGWYLFDSEKGIYQRYAYTAADVTVPEEKSGAGSIVVIILVIIIVILMAAIGLLILKLREYTVYDGEYDDEDDEEYSDNEDFEDLEELEDDETENVHQARRPQPKSGAHQTASQPVRRLQPQSGVHQTASQPVRRPQPQSGAQQAGSQPVRRPQPQTGAQQAVSQPVRRPQPQSGAQQAASQPVRRPQPQPGAQQTASQPVRRPQPQSGTQAARHPQGTMGRNPQGARPQGQRPAPGQGNPQGAVRRPQPQSDNMRPQKGYKAKNMLDQDDDDMDFMDI